MLAIPLALCGLELFHPVHFMHDIPAQFFPVARWWLTLHVAQLVLFAMMGGVVYTLTAGRVGIAARVSQLGAGVFAVFYNAGDAVLGIATGILGLGASQLSPVMQGARAESIATIFHNPVIGVLYDIGKGGWFVAILTAAISLFRAGSPRMPLLFLLLSGFMLWFFDHPTPYGPIAFGSFFIAIAWLEVASPRILMGAERFGKTILTQ